VGVIRDASRAFKSRLGGCVSTVPASEFKYCKRNRRAFRFGVLGISFRPLVVESYSEPRFRR
jgi:hypothetical protein